MCKVTFSLVFSAALKTVEDVRIFSKMLGHLSCITQCVLDLSSALLKVKTIPSPFVILD